MRLWASFIPMAAMFLYGAEQPFPSGVQADHVIVIKSQRILTLMNRGRVLKNYKVALGGDPIGPKVREGDHKTPEGNYVLDRRNDKSRFYRSIHISYPDEEATARAARIGVSPGGDVFVHGLPNGFGWLEKSHLAMNWTDGCIAVTNPEMDEIWRAVPNGTPIEIKP